ncbi:MAG TPA: 2-deoxy-D-gluconate 3-dehydrogenase, partial [Clostridiales bacterium]|nr:2-deoxy-D-gluconate 3-dehydrogenase [Clostridiales bacterium]
MFDLTGKKALVTGGSRGLGKAMAEALIEFGAKVVITGTRKKIMDVAKEIGAIAGIQGDFLLNGQVE